METPYVQNHQIPALRQGNRAPGSTELRQSFYDTTAYKQKEVWELIVFTVHPTVGVCRCSTSLGVPLPYVSSVVLIPCHSPPDRAKKLKCEESQMACHLCS